MISGRCESVLIRAPVDVLTHQLLWGGVGNGAHCHVCSCKTADVVEVARYAEVGQEHAPLTLLIDVGEHHVGGLDVTVKEALLVRVIQGASHSCDDLGDLVGGHTAGIPLT
ncbi:hypothetical protein A5790_16415 [Mycobacterium sp. 852002-51152_SCH6134967]|nr:hypothetical protein A5790_16415 [Mycobacterium sp. 852002-51152_SCH6134967]